MTPRYTRTLWLVLLAVVLTTPSVAQNPKADKNAQVIGGSLGTEFWIAIPPNDFANQPTTSLDVQVASAFDTEVTVTDKAADRTYKRKIKANEVRVLTDRTGETNWTWEVREYERVVRKAIKLTAPQPISVYVLNGKYVTSDGFLAIPSSSFGKKYIVTSYYDFREVRDWPAGYLVVSKENGTVVNIKIRGTGAGLARTSGGKQIGDQVTISLDEGDVYCMVGDATTRGVFDLTGTEITSNNPIGVVSFHNRTTMPNLLSNGNGRNHMVEMTPPVETWGKKYVTVEYKRAGTNPAGRGDVFRVIASQPNTNWTLKFYDKATKRLLGQGGGRLTKAGDFADLAQATSPTYLTYGYSVWEADKPIFLMQYSCSANFDGDNKHDPFMINVVPQEQFITSTIFQSPTDPKFAAHFLNLIVWADTADPYYVDNLKSLEIDGKPVWSHPQSDAPTLLFNHMGNNLHWVTIKFNSEAVAHRAKSNGKVKFGGYIYGYGDVDSYGWPAASGFRPTLAIDTMPPVLKFTQECGDFDFEATELRNIPDPPLPTPRDTDQVETGVALIDTVFGENSFNYNLEYITSDPPLQRDPSFKRFKFKWVVVDKSKDAYCVFDVYDFAGNYTRDTIRYFAPKLRFEPAELIFGKTRLGTPKQLTLKVTNITGDTVILEESKLDTARHFTIISGGLPPAVKLANNESVSLVIEYKGDRETTNILTDFDRDSITVRTKCAPFKIAMSGVAAIPRITVTDFDAGVIGVNEQKCAGVGITISNPGSDTLVVTSMTGYAGTSFTVSNPTVPPFPIIVPPNGSVAVKDVCFERSTVGGDTIDVTFQNNGDGPDSVSRWQGLTQEPGPRITGYNWLKRRVNTLHQAVIHVWNAGTEELTLQDVTFLDGSKFFPPGSDATNFVFRINGLLNNGIPVTDPKLKNGSDSIDVLVEFRPGARLSYVQAIHPIWEQKDVGEVLDYLEGEGIQPNIETEGASLSCIETPQSTAVVRDLVITNDGNMDLTCNIAFAAGTDPMWSWQTPPVNPVTVPYTPGNNSVRIPVVFTRAPGYNGGSNLTVEIQHDAIPGNGTDTSITALASTTETFDVGSCAGPDISVTDIDYGRNLANCDNPLLTFTITNTGGGTTNLEIRDMQVVDADAAAFQIVNIVDPLNRPLTLPFVVPPQTIVRVFVRFTPTEPNALPWSDRAYAARIHVINYEEGRPTELRPNVYANLKGTGYVIPFTFALTNNKQGQNVNPGTDGEVTFKVAGSSADWTDAKVTSFKASMIYETLGFAYTNGSVAKMNLPADWTVSEPVRTDIDQVMSRLEFTASGTTALSTNGDLFTFNGTLLLGPNFEQDQNLEVDLGRPCLINTTTGCSTSIVNCALTKRVVSLGQTQFSMRPPTPNPVQSDVTRIEFGVGIKAPTRIDVVNSSGAIVATLVNQVLSDGSYSLDFPVSTLSNGVYSIRIVSADFSATESFVIAR